MNVKTFKGTEMTSLLAQIREECGDGAIILSTTQSNATIEIQVSHALEEDAFTERESRANELPSSGLREVLARQGLAAPRIQQILSSTDCRLQCSIDQAAAEGLSKLLAFDACLPNNARFVALCGPTGVGKTTTIAKLAAQLRIAFDLRIGLIAADSFRVAAGYHLQTYASLLNMPFRLIDEGLSLSTALTQAAKHFTDCDLIFIDTPGFSPRDAERMETLCRELSSLQWIEKLLVLPAPGNLPDLTYATEKFRAAEISRVVLSKVDESGYLGASVSALADFGKPLAFITTGQRVPEDIEPATARRLGWMLTRTIH